jgi:hypothetical protein
MYISCNIKVKFIIIAVFISIDGKIPNIIVSLVVPFVSTIHYNSSIMLIHECFLLSNNILYSLFYSFGLISLCYNVRLESVTMFLLCIIRTY